MTDEDRLTMEKHGITSENKVIYHFQGHRYDRLSDAVNYAEKQSTSAPAKNPTKSI
jgi:hypothetical protein